MLRTPHPFNGGRNIEGDYFFLNPDCLLVTGAVGAAIYCFSTGDVYSLDSSGREAIELLERGAPIPGIQERNHKGSDFIAFLRELEALHLGSFTLSSTPPTRITMPPISSGLQKIWLEIVGGCNLRCVHCYADSSPRKGNGNLSVEKWKCIISEAACLGAKWIQLIGGEPLLYGKKNIFELVSTAEAARYAFIEVFTNGTLIDDEYAIFFAEHKVHVALSLYSSRPEIHDEVTQCPGSFECTIRSAETLQRHDVPFRVGLIIMKQNCQYAEETLAWLKTTFGDIMVSTDVIRCTSGGRCQADLLTSELWQKRLRTTASFPKVSLEKFADNSSGHPCLKGEVCVQSDGRVYPCIMDREHVLGNVIVTDLSKIIAGEATQSIWGLSKDHIPVCRDCEYRYACFDCPPLAAGIAGTQSGGFAKDPFCLYDPHEAGWADAGQFLEKLNLISVLLQSK